MSFGVYGGGNRLKDAGFSSKPEAVPARKFDAFARPAHQATQQILSTRPQGSRAQLARHRQFTHTD